MKKIPKPPNDSSLEVIGSVKGQPRKVKPPPTECKKTSPPNMPVKRRAQNMVALLIGKRVRTESGQDGINIDRALENAAKRQFATEQGAAKLAEWLIDEMEKKKSAERKIKSLLLRCKYAEIPSTLSSFGDVQLAVKDIASSTDHEDIVRLASQQLVRMKKKMSIDEENKEVIVAEENTETDDANEIEALPTAGEATLRDEDSLQEKERVRFSDQQEKKPIRISDQQEKKRVRFSDQKESDDTWQFN